MQAVRLLVEGVGIPESRMTVSTSGIVPRIADFGAEPVRPKLAVSLNAPNEALRTEVMPITKKWTIEKLMAALREFPLRNRERLTFEYVLLGGVNDDVRARARDGGADSRPARQGEPDRAESRARRFPSPPPPKNACWHSRMCLHEPAFRPSSGVLAAATSTPPAASSSTRPSWCNCESRQLSLLPPACAFTASNDSIDCMATLTIRQLDERTKARLRVQAAHHGRSMEEEAREILRSSLTAVRPGKSNLAESIRERFAPFGGVELVTPKRDPIRQPPDFAA